MEQSKSRNYYKGGMMKEPKRMLNIIEGLYYLYQDGEQSQKRAENMLDEIYRIAHLSSKCHNPHKDWQRGALKWEKDLKKHGLI